MQVIKIDKIKKWTIANYNKLKACLKRYVLR